MREACDLILDGPRRRWPRRSAARADEHRRTPMIGRTHGVHAEPMTFGLKLALWYAELQRDVERVRRARDGRVASASSPAPSARSRTCDPSIEAAVCRRLGLEPAPVSSQVIQRDRHAELMTALAITGGVAREVRARDPRPAEDRDRRGRRAVRQGPEGLVGDAAQAQPDRLRADRRAWRGCCAPTRWRRSRTSRCGTSATSRTRRSSASSCPTASSRSITCCGASRASSPAWSSTRIGCSRTSSARAAWCSPARCCSSSRSAASRASRPTSGCSATRCGRSTSSATSRRCCWPTRTSCGVLPPAEIERAFDLDEQLRHVDTIFDRVFGHGRVLGPRVRQVSASLAAYAMPKP